MEAKVDWKFWWEQVLKGVIPESVYRMAKIREQSKGGRRMS